MNTYEEKLRNILQQWQVQTVTKSTDNLLCLCPLHMDTKPSLSISFHPNKWGIWFCFGCLKRGNLEQLAEYLKQNIYEPITVSHTPLTKLLINHLLEPTSRTKPQLPTMSLTGQIKAAEYLQMYRNYEPETANQIVADFYLYTGRQTWKDFLIIPILNIEGQISYFTSRNISGGQPKIKNPSMPKKSNMFPLFQILQWFTTDYIILTEGPFDALRLISYGYPALATLGGPNIMQLQLVKTLFNHVFTAFDSDPQGRNYAKMVKEYMPNTTIIHCPYQQEPDTIPPDNWNKIFDHYTKQTKLYFQIYKYLSQYRGRR